MIPQHSTNPAQTSLTSVIGRERVRSGWYDRAMRTWFFRHHTNWLCTAGECEGMQAGGVQWSTQRQSMQAGEGISVSRGVSVVVGDAEVGGGGTDHA